jgi:hypothetical protein
MLLLLLELTSVPQLEPGTQVVNTQTQARYGLPAPLIKLLRNNIFQLPG